MAAVTAIASTTLSSAITATQLNIPVASAASITTSMVLLIRNEVLQPYQVDTTNNIVYCKRGVNGSLPFAQASSTRVYYATPDTWQTLRNNAMSVVGANSTLPQYLMPGQRATDGAGNEYIMVDLTSTCYSGTTVMISNDGLYTATQAAGGNQGSIGLTLEEGSSNQWTWAQIYGYNSYAQETVGDSAGTSALLALAATTPSTPSVGLATAAVSSVGRYYINGMFIAGIPTTATTSATSSTGVAYPVFLNYPYIVAALQDLSSL